MKLQLHVMNQRKTPAETTTGWGALAKAILRKGVLEQVAFLVRRGIHVSILSELPNSHG